MIFSNLIPTYVCKNTYDIDYNNFYNKGYNAIIFDIDNTLVLHDEEANEKVKLLINDLHKIGYKIFVLSNNSEDRVKKFCNYSGINNYVFDGKKPSKKNYIKIVNISKIDKKKILCIGDQLLTDIWGANNAGITSILVEPQGKEIYFHIKLKRVIENIVKIINKKEFVNREYK